MPAWAILIGIAVFVVLGVVLIYSTRNVPSSAEVWKQLAAGVAGSYRYAPLGFRHEVRFTKNGWPIVMGQASSLEGIDGAASVTNLYARVEARRAKPFVMQIETRAQRLPVLLTLGRQPGEVILTGDARLDADFEVRTTDAALAKLILLQPHVSDALHVLARPSTLIQFDSSKGDSAKLGFETQDIRVSRQIIDETTTLLVVLLGQLAQQGVVTR